MKIGQMLRIERLLSLAGRGTSLLVGGNILVNLSRIASTVVLTRLLSSADFGISGVITSITVVLSLLSDLGFYAFLIRHPKIDDDEFLDHVWTVRVIRGAILTVLTVALSGPIAAVIEQPAMQPVIAFSGLLLLIESVASLSFATGVRHGHLGRLAIFDTLPAIAQVALGIFLAYLIPNYWALVLATLGGGMIKALVSYVAFPRSSRRLRVNRGVALEIWVFGRYIAASSAIHLAITQADKLILAKTLTLNELGLYVIAGNIAAAPGMIMGSYSQRILYPVFARIATANPEALAVTFYATGRRVRLLYQFVAGGFIACAPLIIAILYEPAYQGASVYLRVLAVGALFRLTTASASDCLVALGQARHVFRVNLAKLTWLGLGIASLGSLYGGIGIVLAFGTAEIGGQLYCWWAMGRKGLLRLNQEAEFVGLAVLGLAIGLVMESVLT